MANQDQLALLKQGVAVWNAWRKEKPTINVDLIRANLSEANLREAYLREAYLRDAHLIRADLSEAYLSGANLREADLSGANLTEATFTDAKCSYTVFGNVDFSQVKGLETVCFSVTTCHQRKQRRNHEKSISRLRRWVIHRLGWVI